MTGSGSSTPGRARQDGRPAAARNKYAFRIGDYNAGCDLVERYHYSGRVPSNVQMVCSFHWMGGLFGDYGDAAAAVFISVPPTRWAEPVMELSRLVAHPDFDGHLSALISLGMKAAKRHTDLVVSFADRTHRHHGGVYQASNWNYAGARDRRMDGVVIDGVFVPGRSANSRFGTRSPAKLTERLKRDVVGHFDEGKHCYWKDTTRAGRKKAQRLGLGSLPYPKEFADAAE